MYRATFETHNNFRGLRVPGSVQALSARGAKEAFAARHAETLEALAKALGGPAGVIVVKKVRG